VSALVHVVARDSDFQAAWYYSAVIFAGLCLTVWAAWLALRPLRSMYARGDRGLAVALGSATLVALLMFASMLATVAVALWPQTQGGAGG
jgi:hypothetical protein